MKSAPSEPTKTNAVYFNRLIPWMDARIVALVGNLGLVLLSVIFFDLQRSWTQISLTLACALAVEGLLFSATRKYRSQVFVDRIPSALAEAGSCLVLCRSKVLWMHPLMVAMAVVSKYVVRKNERDHIFNPANLAIIFSLCLVPPQYYEFRPDDYSVSIYPLIHVTVAGLLATWLAGVWRVTLGYLAAAWILAIALFSNQNYPDLIHAIGPEIGTSSLIFAWLMITDPRSAPRAAAPQIAFGAMIAIVHMSLRFYEITYSRFIALFFVTAAFYFGGWLLQLWRPDRSLLPVRSFSKEAAA